jgi:hypothetical protein
MKVFIFIGIFSLFVLTGCQTGIFINDSPAAMTDIRKAFVVVMGEPQNTSFNGKELTSKFHDKRGRHDEALSKAKSRYFTRMSILGDRRPYKIKIEVFHEVRISPQQYEIVGEDLDLAQSTAKKIEETLNQSLKNRNVIDDFRAF